MHRAFPLFLTLFLLSCTAEETVEPNPDEAAPSSTATSAIPVSESAAVSATPVASSDVSIPALMRMSYDGHNFALGQVLDDNAAYTRYAITYEGDGLTISGIMNIPKGTGPFPVLILNHGHIPPIVYTTGRGLKREQDYLARQGYAVLHSDYRNHAGSSKDPDAELKLRFGYVADVINAVYAIRSFQDPRIEASRIGMLGHSMGGGITTNVLVSQPDLVDAAVLYAGISPIASDNFEKWVMRQRPVAEKILQTYGSPAENPTFWKEASAQTYLSKIAVPVELYHGTKDLSVPYEWSVRLEKDLKALGKDATLHTFEGERHEFGPQWTAFMQGVTAFFDSHVK